MKWIFRLSNSHQQLSQKEVTTLLRPHSVKWLMPLLGVVKCNANKIETLLRYTASVKLVIKNVKIIEINGDIYDTLNNLNPNVRNLEANVTFAVRFHSIFKKKFPVSSSKVERIVGSIIYNKGDNLEVDLDNPYYEYIVILWDHKLVAGWKHSEPNFSRIYARSPKESPYFGGGAMKPMLSKILVNLLYPFSPVIIDPFSGHGGFLREIANNEIHAIGIELDPKIARESKINNTYHGYDDMISLIIGDATKQPLRVKATNQYVCDPPYAIQTTTGGISRDELVKRWLKSLQSGSLVVITTPKGMLDSISDNWEVDLEIEDYVHKSLTRVARRMIKV